MFLKTNTISKWFYDRFSFSELKIKSKFRWCLELFFFFGVDNFVKDFFCLFGCVISDSSFMSLWKKKKTNFKLWQCNVRMVYFRGHMTRSRAKIFHSNNVYFSLISVFYSVYLVLLFIFKPIANSDVIHHGQWQWARRTDDNYEREKIMALCSTFCILCV